MKKLLLGAVIVAAMFVGASLAACNQKIIDPEPQIELTSPTRTVNVGSDQTTAGDLVFTARSAWKLTINEGDKAASWLRVKNGNTLIASGVAGSHTFITELDANQFQQQRTAEIIISCGSESVVIAVNQSGTGAR